MKLALKMPAGFTELVAQLALLQPDDVCNKVVQWNERNIIRSMVVEELTNNATDNLLVFKPKKSKRSRWSKPSPNEKKGHWDDDRSTTILTVHVLEIVEWDLRNRIVVNYYSKPDNLTPEGKLIISFGSVLENEPSEIFPQEMRLACAPAPASVQ